jgi:uncharacterized coiled-coil protein SlyX
MSAELIGILSVGVALAALLLTSVNSLREGVRALREGMRRVENRLDTLEQRMENRLDALEQRMARLEGVLDGLREALFGRSREAAG